MCGRGYFGVRKFASASAKIGYNPQTHLSLFNPIVVNYYLIFYEAYLP